MYISLYRVETLILKLKIKIEACVRFARVILRSSIVHQWLNLAPTQAPFSMPRAPPSGNCFVTYDSSILRLRCLRLHTFLSFLFLQFIRYIPNNLILWVSLVYTGIVWVFVFVIFIPYGYIHTHPSILASHGSTIEAPHPFLHLRLDHHYVCLNPS